MLSLFRNLFGRRSRFHNPFSRRTPALTPKRGGIALGSLLSLAAPFIIRKLQQRRAARMGAY